MESKNHQVEEPSVCYSMRMASKIWSDQIFMHSWTIYFFDWQHANVSNAVIGGSDSLMLQFGSLWTLKKDTLSY